MALCIRFHTELLDEKGTPAY